MLIAKIHMKYPKYSGMLPVAMSLAVKIKAVNGLTSIIVFIIPVSGIAYTTGVIYINKLKPIFTNLAMSL